MFRILRIRILYPWLKPALFLSTDSCNEYQEQTECIESNYNCSYCFDLSFDGFRCDTPDRLVENGCENLCSPNFEVSPDDESTRCVIVITPGTKRNVTVTFKLHDHPLDFYYLMDVSGSMDDDKANLLALSTRLVGTLANLTDDLRLGYGSFVDKPKRPFGNPRFEWALFQDHCFGLQKVLII